MRRFHGLGRSFITSPNRFAAGGGAVLAGAAASPLIGAFATAAPDVNVPEVDRVAVRIVTDNIQFAVAPSCTAGTVEIERFGWGIGRIRPKKR